MGHSEETKAKISKTRKEKIASGEIIVTIPINPKSVRTNLTEKKCAGCNIIKTIDNFSKKTEAADGYQPYCSECAAEARKKNREVGEFKCVHCSNVYKYKDSLNRHIKQTHK